MMISMTELKGYLTIAFEHNGWNVSEWLDCENCWQLSFQKKIGFREIKITAEEIADKFFSIEAEEIIPSSRP